MLICAMQIEEHMVDGKPKKLLVRRDYIHHCMVMYMFAGKDCAST
jgi:hypothetical protein